MPDAAPAAPAAAAPSAPPPATAASPPPAGGAPAVAKPGEKAPEGDVAKHKVKVDGQEQEVTLEDLIRGYQTDQTGQKRLKDAAEKEKVLAGEKEKTGKVIAAAKTGDYKALIDLGLSDDEVEKLAVGLLSAKQQSVLEEERRKALDPATRELEDLRREKEQREKKDKETATAEEHKRVETATVNLRQQAIGTLDLLPPELRSEVFAGRVIQAWEYAVEHAEEIEQRGIKVTPQYVADKVRAEAIGLYGKLLEGAKDEELDKLIPAAVLERLAKRKAVPVVDPPPPPKKPAAQHPALGDPLVRTAPVVDERRPHKTEAQIVREILTRKA